MHRVRVPLSWLTEGRLPPVCVLTGRPAGGETLRVKMDLRGARRVGERAELAVEAVSAATGMPLQGLASLDLRRVEAILPFAPGAYRSARRKAFLLVGGPPVALLLLGIATVEFGWEGWPIQTAFAVGSLLLVVALISASLLRVTGSLGQDGTVRLLIPSREAARAIRAAFAGAGMAPTRRCWKCGTEASGASEGLGDEEFWICAACVPPGRAGAGGEHGRRGIRAGLDVLRLALWGLLRLPWSLLVEQTRRDGLSGFCAGAAVLLGLAGGFCSLLGVSAWVVLGAGLLLSTVAWLRMRGDPESGGRKAALAGIVTNLTGLGVDAVRLLGWI
jgi:hypothetical protein